MTATELAYTSRIFATKQRIKQLEEKLLYWYVFFMAFPAIVILFNFNLYIFPFLAALFYKRYGYFIKIVSIVQVFAIAFMVGATIATFNSLNFGVSMGVLPNYIYWGFIILFFVSHRHNFNQQVIFKALSHGLIGSTIYFFFAQELVLPFIPIAREMAQNGYAFLLICFAPAMVYYIKNQKGNWQGIITLILLIIFSFLSGSRAGSVLVLVGGSLAFIIDKLNFKYGAPTLITVSILIVLLETTGLSPFFIKTLNPEAFDLIYKSDEVFQTDISYLTRVAMVQKGLNIYSENPIDGIGLNLFKEVQGTVEGKTEWIQMFNFKDLETGISSHNSYINILAEGGLVLFVPTILLLIYCFFHFLIGYNSLTNQSKVTLIGLIVMCTHMYFVTAIVNVFAWFNIALAAAMVIPMTKKRKQKRTVPAYPALQSANDN